MFFGFFFSYIIGAHASIAWRIFETINNSRAPIWRIEISVVRTKCFFSLFIIGRSLLAPAWQQQTVLANSHLCMVRYTFCCNFV